MMMRRNYDSDDSEFAVAIAASANAIHALEEGRPKVQMTRPNTRKQEPFGPPRAGSVNRPFTKGTRASSSFVRPRPSLTFDQVQRENGALRRHAGTTSGSKADAWEKAQLAKIRKRYEKMESEIAAWENEKKLRMKHQMERKKAELEQRKSRNLKHYQIKAARIGRIAGAARSQVDEKWKQDESVVKEKARKMRSTGQTPVNCFCF